MRRAVITGAGIISCLGNNLEEVRSALKEGRSGIRFNQSYADIGMRSQISGSVRLNTEELIDRKLYRFMGEASAYAYLSMDEAIRDADSSWTKFPAKESVWLSAQAAVLRKTSLNRRIFSEKRVSDA